MFEREHHRRIEAVLRALDPDLFARSSCLFGGGTAMALRFGEYRESVDIDFLVSDIDGYREMRGLLTTPDGIDAVSLRKGAVEQIRDVRADQYGIRTMLRIDKTAIKFEIVSEGRIELEAPGDDDRICGIPTLTALDMATRKLLANSDRWRDDSVSSRDLIDLAMMNPPRKLLATAIEKASTPYGPSITEDLHKAITLVRERRGWLEHCMIGLRMTTVPRAQVLQRIRNISKRLET